MKEQMQKGEQVGSKQGRIGFREEGKAMGSRAKQRAGGKGVEEESLEEEAGGERVEVEAEGDMKAVRRVRKGRTVRKLSRGLEGGLGGLSLRVKTGRGREVVRVVGRSLDVETRKEESPERRREAHQGEKQEVESGKRRSRVGIVARSVARRMASGGRKGLFGQY
jgi:hypothetical protein